MVTGNYLAYDPQSRSYRLPAEFVPVLADEDSPYFAGGIIQLSVPFVSMAPRSSRPSAAAAVAPRNPSRWKPGKAWSA